MRTLENFLFVLCVVLALKLILFDKAYPHIPKKYIKIEINNPYSVSIKAEIKCDWRDDIEEYLYQKTLLLQTKTKIVIELPSYLKKCEILPTKVNFFRRVK